MKNRAYRLVAVLCVLALCFTACGKSSSSVTSTTEASPSAEATDGTQGNDDTATTDSTTGETADPATEPASGDDTASDPSQTPEGGDAEVVVEPHYAILVVSTGSTSEESNNNSIGAIETAISDQCPEYEIRRAFSDPAAVAAFADQEEPTDSVEAALERCVTDGVTHLVVQPTYLTEGAEYETLKATVDSYRAKFQQLELGNPFLTVEDDYYFIAGMLSNLACDYDDGATGFVFLGDEDKSKVYSKIQGLFDDGWGEHCYIASMNDDAGFQKILKKVKKAGYKKVMLIPVVVSVSDQTMEKINGAAQDSWKSRLQANGVKKVKTLKMGFGEIPGITEIYAAHVSETAGAVY